MAHLTIIKGGGVGRRFNLDRVLCIGRGMDMEIRIDDLTASKRHARVTSDARGGCILEDLGSSNGSFVNDLAIQQTYHLHDGDEIRIGAHVIEFSSTPSEAMTNVDPDRTLIDINPDSSATSVISAVEMGSTGSYWNRGERSTLEDLTAKNARLMTLVDIIQTIDDISSDTFAITARTADSSSCATPRAEN